MVYKFYISEYRGDGILNAVSMLESLFHLERSDAELSAHKLVIARQPIELRVLFSSHQNAINMVAALQNNMFVVTRVVLASNGEVIYEPLTDTYHGSTQTQITSPIEEMKNTMTRFISTIMDDDAHPELLQGAVIFLNTLRKVRRSNSISTEAQPSPMDEPAPEPTSSPRNEVQERSVPTQYRLDNREMALCSECYNHERGMPDDMRLHRHGEMPEGRFISCFHCLHVIQAPEDVYIFAPMR